MASASRAQRAGPLQVPVGVVQARHQRTPVQDGPVPAACRGAHQRQRVGGDGGRIRLDPRVIDTGIGEQQRHLEVHQLIQPPDIGGLHLVPRDDQHMVPQAPAVQVGQHRQRVRPDRRQERVRRPVQHLDRGHVRPEVPVADQPLHRLGVGHQGARLALIPQAVGVPQAVRAIQRAALNVVQAQPALAVLHHLTGTLRQARSLLPVQQRDECAHLGPPGHPPGTGAHWEGRAAPSDGQKVSQNF